MENKVILSNESSASINFLKVILSIGVVIIHSKIDPVSWTNLQFVNDCSIFAYFQKFFVSGFLGSSCVQIFFVISGYLFFLNIKSFFYDYKKKIAKRIYSILIPYLLANTIFVLYSLLVNNGNIIDIIGMYWSYKGTYQPIDAPLWYLRNLMIIFLISPLLYWIIRKNKYISIMGLAILYIFSRGEITVIIESLLFSVIGMSLSLAGKDLVKYFSSFGFITIPIFLLLVLFTGFVGINISDNNNIYNLFFLLSQIFSLPAFFYSVDKLSYNLKSTRIVRFLVGASFFAYMYHYQFNLPSRFYHNLSGVGSIQAFISFFCGIVLTLLILIILYSILNKYFKIFKYFIGNR